MSISDFNTDIKNLLELNFVNSNFSISHYPNSDSCLRFIKKNNITYRFINIISSLDKTTCPHCGCINSHFSKGFRKKFLKHKSTDNTITILEVSYRRYKCRDCLHYFKEDIPFQFYNMRMSKTAAHSCLFHFKENHSMASISRIHGFGKNTMYRLFSKHIDIPLRYYHLSSVISIDEFRATTDQGCFAFNIVNPINGITLDIIADRKASYLRNYFLRFPYDQRKRVKIIIMDLSGAFKAIMSALFPNATIIADKFHYTRLVRNCMTQARINNCKNIRDKSLAKLIKNNLHLFDQYKDKLNDDKARYVAYYKKHMTNKQLVETIITDDRCDDLYNAYNIYQAFLKILHKPHSDYKEALNNWLDNIFNTNNEFFISTAKNFRKNWFIPILKSLTYKAKYIRNNKTYLTSFNNGFIESMNNKVKLVKRNAYGFKSFENLRKRILLHLGFHYSIVENIKKEK